MSEQKIRLDCPPGSPRPGDLIADVIKDTGLPARDDISRFMGEWTWDYSDVPRETWEKAQPVLEGRITALHAAGQIRYGSWG